MQRTMAWATTSRGASSARGSSAEHEALAVLVAQVGPFAADRLADEVAAGAGDVEHRGMELHELHVAQLGAGAIGRGHAVAGRHRRVGRLAVDHAGAAAGQDGLLGPDQQLAVRRPPHQRADAAALVRQQVDREGVVPDGDVRRLAGRGR